MRYPIFSLDSSMIASTDYDGNIKIWDYQGNQVFTFKNGSGVGAIRFISNEDSIVSADFGGNIKLWGKNGKEVNSFVVKNKFELQDFPLQNIVGFSPNNKIIASIKNPFGQINISTYYGKSVTDIVHREYIDSVSFSADNKLLASASNNSLRLWSLESPQINSSGFFSSLNAFFFTSNGQTIVTRGSEPNLELWNNGKKYANLIGNFRDLSLSLDGSIIASANWEDTIQIWDSYGKQTRMWKAGQSDLSSIALTSDGDLIASAGRSGSVKLWNIDGQEIAMLEGYRSDAGVGRHSIRFSPDGQILAAAAEASSIKLWNRSGKLLAILKGHQGPVNSVGFSPDSQTIVSASSDGSIKLWSRTGKEITTFRGHQGGVADVSFSPDGEVIASASEFGEFKLWNRDGRELHTFKEHQVRGTIVGFSPDGKTIGMVGSDGIMLLDFNLDNLMNKGCSWLTDYLKNNPNVKEDDRRMCGLGS
jgi:WD40 repeat protein